MTISFNMAAWAFSRPSTALTPAFGTAFSTYAVPVILGEIRRFLRDDGSIHVARSIKENARRVEEARQGVLQASGREPTVDELCEALDLEREDILLALNARQERAFPGRQRRRGWGVDPQRYAGHGLHGGGRKKAPLGEPFEDALPREDMRLIALRYFQRRTQTEIAKEMGVSQAQVSRMESRILKRLREYAEIGL